jgi:ATP-dependent helicase YprA (DUF1998 family)
MTNLREGIESLHRRHREYIEATYHIRHPQLIRGRKRILEQLGGAMAPPWIEATPAYESGPRLSDLKVPTKLIGLLQALNREGFAVYDPLYRHQVDALEAFFDRGQDLVVSSGTGSGKTEIFLYAILGSLVQEAERGRTVSQRGMRAIILYPMNALVSDQLSRLRRTLGDQRASALIQERFGRLVQFGMYTSRTPYHGAYDVDRNDRYVKPIVSYFASLATQPDKRELFGELRKRGRIPAKDVVGFAGARARESRYHTQLGDRELFTRQEMHSPNQYGGTPDVLVTNYSMLEYMLLRPIEQPLFDTTRKWLSEDSRNKVILVIDEAHLYRGAQGAEVALLIRRLLRHLGIGRDRVRCILTSASLGASFSAVDTGRIFASRLTGGSPDRFSVVLGTRRKLGGTAPLPDRLGNALQSVSSDLERTSLSDLAEYFGWPLPLPEDSTELRQFLGRSLRDTPEFKTLHDYLSEAPTPAIAAGERLFPGLSTEQRLNAVLNFALVATTARDALGSPLLPVRLHLLFRGLPRMFTCVNPKCPSVNAGEAAPLLGGLFLSPRLTCTSCGSRVFELYTHRTCGAALLKAYVDRNDLQFPRFLWTQDESGELQEVHLLLEPPRQDPDPTDEASVPLTDRIAARYLDKRTGYLLEGVPRGEEEEDFIKCWWPPEAESQSRRRNRRGDGDAPSDSESRAWSWPRCYACGITEKRWKGQTKVMDLETKGEDPFANIVKTAFYIQPPVKADSPPGARPLPNQGRKVLCFSDGRQKAARLARDLQRAVEQDSFRELLALAASRSGDDAPLEALYANLALVCRENQVALFDDGDGREGSGEYEGSRSVFIAAQQEIPRLVREYNFQSEAELVADRHTRAELSGKRPRQFDQSLLRALGDRNFSMRASLVGYVAPLPSTLHLIQKLNSKLSADLVENLVLAAIDTALEDRALDPSVSPEDRELSRRSLAQPRGYPRPGGEGFSGVEIVPEDARKALTNVPETEMQSLSASLRRGSGDAEPLFVSGNSRYWLNPKAVTLRVSASRKWFECEGCGQFTPFHFSGKCPDYKCQGVVRSIDEDDLYVRTRKSFLRTPVIEVLSGERRPFTLRSEEHTAQLTARDASTVFGKAERYELLFQDVLVDDLANQQPVDVLSCTTTMEVGIDIGSLNAVALRTVPPRPDNYQQRAGRAGRRGTALSFITTFADNSPHETFVFENPDQIVGVESGAPVVYVQNVKIAERHLDASFLQSFFQRGVGPSATEEAKRWNVFESLGTARAFFAEKGPYSLEAFDTWGSSEILANEHGLADQLGELLPTELSETLPYGSDLTWRRRFVQDVAKRFVEGLRAHGKRRRWQATEEEDNLLSNLLDAGFLPTFSFPLDLCSFVVRDFDRSKRKVVNRYEMQQDLSQALSEYVPGREIVVDKHTFVSYGLFFPFSHDPANRGRSVDWDGLPWLNHCLSCGITIEESERNLERERSKCSRGHLIESIPRYRPEGFAPRVSQISGAVEGYAQGSERLYASSAEFPLPVVPTPPPGVEVQRISSVATVRKLPNQLLVVTNLGPKKDGFTVCRDCGAVALDEDLPAPHDRPYQIESWLVSGSKRKGCEGNPIRAAFAYDFRTDLAILSVKAQPPLNFAFNSDWFKAAAISLSEALILGATRALDIESSELAGGWRVVPRYEGDSAETKGHFEFFLYDTTPGGAGFAADAANRYADVLDSARKLLKDCTCETSCHRCLRTYDNRVSHEQLTRHGALALLHYAETGEVPDVADQVRHLLLEQLTRAIRLRDVGVLVNQDPSGALVVRRGPKGVEVRLSPALREGLASLTTDSLPPSDLPSASVVLTVTDAELKSRLPFAVERVLEAVR